MRCLTRLQHKNTISNETIERFNPSKSVMSNPFFDQPILNSPYEFPCRHWELDSTGQPTQKIIGIRRLAEFISPIPKPKKRKKQSDQLQLQFDEGHGLSTKEQQYDTTSVINEVRRAVGQWRAVSNPSEWHVTPETARLLQHWRTHKFNGVRPSSARWKPLKPPSGYLR